MIDLLGDVVGLDVETRVHLVARRLERAAHVVAGAVEVVEQIAAALADRVDHGIAGAPERERDVLAFFRERAGDALRRVVDARRHHLADRADVLGEPEVHAGERVAHLLGLAHQRVALVGEVLDQPADAQLVVVIGALELGDFVVHQRLQFGGARERALDAVAHGGDFAPDRLTDAHDRFAGDAFRLGEAQGRVGHRGRDRAQLLRAAYHVGEHEDERDRHDDRAENAEQLRRGGAPAEPLGDVGAEIAERQRDPEPRPHDGENAGRNIRTHGRASRQRRHEASAEPAVVVRGAARRLRLLDAGLVGGSGRRVQKQIFVDRRAPAPRFAGGLGLGRRRVRTRRLRRARLGLAQIESVLDRRQRRLGRILHLPRGVGHVCSSASVLSTRIVARTGRTRRPRSA